MTNRRQTMVGGIGNQQAETIYNITNYRPPAKHFYPQDIKNVIQGFSNCCENYNTHLLDDDNSSLERFDYTEKEHKNEINSLSEEYFEYILNKHLMYFHKIDLFLKDSKNKDLLEKYLNIAKTINFRIATIRANYTTFDEILGVIFHEVMETKESYLVGKENLCITYINYMYWNCDIGRRK